jgi:hypothetical protein
MDTYSGNTTVEVTRSGWSYLAKMDIERALTTPNPLEAADLVAGAKQKLVLAAESGKLDKSCGLLL